MIEQNSFGLLVSTREGGPIASHLPFLVHRDAGTQGTLVSHLARGNPQWQDLDGAEVLCVFSGPHAYISPTWYAAKQVVPTWNYIAVHVYGTFRVIDDPHRSFSLVKEFVEHYEAAFAQPWSLPADEDYARKMVAGIVGFEIEIRRLEGKWKLSQNHPRDRQERVAKALAEQRKESSHAIAAMMHAKLTDSP